MKRNCLLAKLDCNCISSWGTTNLSKPPKVGGVVGSRRKDLGGRGWGEVSFAIRKVIAPFQECRYDRFARPKYIFLAHGARTETKLDI